MKSTGKGLAEDTDVYVIGHPKQGIYGLMIANRTWAIVKATAYPVLRPYIS